MAKPLAGLKTIVGTRSIVGNQPSLKKLVVYVDGFNLYYGLREGFGRKYLWLDLEDLSTKLLKPGQQLVSVRYFTAALRNDQGGQRRQQAYLGALRSKELVATVLGRFQEKHSTCSRCGYSWRSYEEKETDVSIAVALLEDAVGDVFDTALVISADSDLCPAVRALKRRYPSKRVVVVFPPKRRSDALRKVADATFTLGHGLIRASLLPPTVTDSKGVTYTRPPTWR